MAGLTDRARNEVYARATARTAAAKATLFFEGDARTRHLAILTAGFAKVSTVAMGDESVLAIRGPGDLLGESFVLGGLARAATVTALGPMTYLAVTETEFAAFLDREPEAHRALAATLAARLHWANRRRAEANAFPPLVRLARLLVDVGSEFGEPTRGGVLLTAPLTQADLASMISLSVATVEKASRRLRDQRLLQSDRRRRRFIDLDGLRALDDRVS
jgi:CRP/FNR family cyclic AMP-dependent transcriptional regulator